VGRVCSPEWTDDELLQELRAALQEEPVAESVIRAAQAAGTAAAAAVVSRLVTRMRTGRG